MQNNMDARIEIWNNMVDIAPFEFSERQKPYILEAMQRYADYCVKEIYTESYFVKLSEKKPEITGNYEVITNRGRMIKIRGEKFLNLWVWETNIDAHKINEQVIAWRFLN
jgi:hypothetical protein